MACLSLLARQIALSLRDDYYFLALQFLLNCFTYTPNMVLYDVKPDKLRYLYSRGIEDLTIFPSEFHNYLFWLPYRFPNLKKLQLHFKIPVDGNINLSNNCDGQSITNDFFDCWLCGFNAKTHKQLNTIVLLGYRPRAPRTVYSSFAANNIMPDFFTNENLLYQARVYVVGDGRLFKVQDEGLKVRKLAEIYGWANDIDTVCDHLRNCYITGVDNKWAVRSKPFSCNASFIYHKHLLASIRISTNCFTINVNWRRSFVLVAILYCEYEV